MIKLRTISPVMDEEGLRGAASGNRRERRRSAMYIRCTDRRNLRAVLRRQREEQAVYPPGQGAA